MRRFGSTQPLPDDVPVRSYPRPSLMAEPITGPKALAKLGIETWGDLIEHLPHAHRDRREVRLVSDLALGEDATVAVGVRSVTVKPMRDRRRKRVEARVFDESGPLVAVWFNQPWIARQLGEGAAVLLHGKLRRRGEFWVTEFERFDGAPVHTVGLVPVHPATEGISAAKLRELMWEAHPRMLAAIEPLPSRLRTEERLPDRPAALSAAHFPDREEDEAGARRRLAFEELFLLQLAVAGRRRARREGRRARPLAPRGVVVDRWRWSLPFELTADQQAATGEIDADLERETPMQRLLMGEVGSGKTVVALHAMLRAVENGAQAALMAPTETLAEQHHRTLDELLGGSLGLELLTGSTSAARRRDLLGRLASGQLQLVVGTHALIEPAVEFRDLALVVVDEQHRFGVRQRAALDAKAPDGLAPHALHMTATPIPRTLSLTAYGDLDATALRTLPKGRRPVETHVVDGAKARARAYERIREEIAAGRQCFVVCPLVEESETLQAKAATAEFERLRDGEFRDQRVELIHGQMPSKQKSAAMEAFAAGRGGRARGHERDRGGHRRAERHGDADRGRRALRPVAAAPAARAGGPRRTRLALHRLRRPAPAAPRGDRARARRLPAGRDRPRAARRRRRARHPPARAARVPRGAPPGGHRAARPRPRPRRRDPAGRPAARAARARPAARRGGGPLRLRARPDPRMNEIVRILDRGYEMIWREDRLEEALRGLEPEFEWVVPRHPDGEVRRGPEATIAFFRDWRDSWEDLEVEWELLPAGESRVLAIVVMRGRGPGSGAPVEMRVGQLWTLRRHEREAHGHVLGPRRSTRRGRPVRVVAGEFGGRRLAAPRGARTRPTADRVREALFSMLGDLSGLRVLDLYAGSGALGIEALSRGAGSAVFVESDARAAAVLERNLASLGLEQRVLRRDVLRFLGVAGGQLRPRVLRPPI